jgi:hypothetical protein
MADTERTQTEILALLADNSAGAIGPQDIRDSVVSARANEGAGWAFYTEGTAITQGTAQAITAVTRTQLLNDGLGGATHAGQIQNMIVPWSSNKLNVELDCAYNVRVTFKGQIASGASGQYFTIDLDIGGAIGITWAATIVFAKGTAIEHAFEFSIPLFARSTFVANGGKFYITPSVDMDLWDARVLVGRVYQPDN